MRLRHFATALSAVSLLSFAAAACSEQADGPVVAQGEATTAPAPPIEANALPDDTVATPGAVASIDLAERASELVPEAEKGEKGARNVLLAWARALENKQFARARAQWGDRGRRSGMSQAAYAAQFDGYRRITIGFGEGEVEGAAGSLYYEAPVALRFEAEKQTG